MVENTMTERRVDRHTNGDTMYRDNDVAVYGVAEPTRPMDRVRWGAILAGLVTALSTLAVLSVLGLAIGLTNYDAGDQLRNFGMGAGIWGAISTIVAFILGGWVAARSAAVRGRGNALLNGAMVWAIAVPMIMFLVGSGVGSLMGMATDVATDVAAGVAPALADDATAADVEATTDAVQAQAAQVDSATVNQTVNQATENASEAAWGTLIALLLGLAAATIGGLMGERKESELVLTA